VFSVGRTFRFAKTPGLKPRATPDGAQGVERVWLTARSSWLLAGVFCRANLQVRQDTGAEASGYIGWGAGGGKGMADSSQLMAPSWSFSVGRTFRFAKTPGLKPRATLDGALGVEREWLMARSSWLLAGVFL